MSIYGVASTINYVAWDTAANAGKTGDVLNHTLRWIKDGVSAAPTNAPAEVDAINAPGVYKLTLTAAEAQAVYGTLAGKSSTADVSIMPVPLSFERILSDAALANLESILDDTGGQIKLVSAAGKPGLEITSNIATESAAHISQSQDASSAAMTIVTNGAQSNALRISGSDVNAGAISLDSEDGRGISGLKVNTDQISGDGVAADNLEAMLDGTGGVELQLSQLNIVQTTPAENAVNITANSAGSAGIVINATDATGTGIIFNTGLGTIDLDGSDLSAQLTAILADTGTTLPAQVAALNNINAADVWDAAVVGLITAGSVGELLVGNVDAPISSIGGAAAAAILTTPANTIATDAAGNVGISDVDGVTFAKLLEIHLAYMAGKTTLTDNGNGTKTLRFFKQDGVTPIADITFNGSGEWTATQIDPAP